MFENIKCLTANFPWDWFLFLLLPLLGLWWWLTKDGNKDSATVSGLQDRINFLEGELDACRKTKANVNVAPTAKVDVSGYESRIKVLESELNSALKAKAANFIAPVAAVAGTAAVAATAEVNSLKDKVKVLEAELNSALKAKAASFSASVTETDELKAKVRVLETELNSALKAKAASFVASVGAVTAAAAPVIAVASASTKDDLQIVEGIGPKIEELFNSKGIYTFEQLAKTPASTLKEILDAAGSRFQMHDPATWPEQGAMARDGKWDELKKWQDELNKGREK